MPFPRRERRLAPVAMFPNPAPQHAAPTPVAYLVNAYPKVSHSFVRREIAALERLGQPVVRVSIRPSEGLVDTEDLAERERTTVLLDRPGIAGAVVRALARPVALARSAAAAWSMAGAAGGGTPSRLRHLAYLAEACRLREITARAGARHLHAHFGTNPAAVARLCRLLGGPPYSFTVHGPEEFDRPVQLSLAEKAADARFVACVSSFGRSQLLRWLEPEDWDRAVIVRCGLDAAYLRDDPGAGEPSTDAAEGLRGDLLVCVGRLCEQKGQHLLIEAVEMLTRRGIPVRLRLVGDGPMRAGLAAAAAQRGVADRIEFVGNASAEEIRGHLRESRALVLPSFAEGLPVVLMEALATRRPVVSTYIAGIPELVDAQCGWLVPAGDAGALADAMAEALAASPERIAQLGAEGRRRVQSAHDADLIAAELLQRFAAPADAPQEASPAPARVRAAGGPEAPGPGTAPQTALEPAPEPASGPSTSRRDRARPLPIVL